MASKSKNLFTEFSDVSGDFLFPGEEDLDQMNAGTPDEQEDADEDVEDAEVEDTEKDENSVDEDALPEDTTEDVAEDTEDDEEFSYAPLVAGHLASGVLALPEGKNLEDYDDTEEGFEEVIKDTVSVRLEETIAALPQRAQQLMRLALKGATDEDLETALILDEAQDWEDIDLENEDVQKAAVEEALRIKEPDLSDEEIQERISDMEDLNKLRREAERSQKFLIKETEKQKAQVEKQIADRKAEELEAYNTEVKKVKDHIFQSEEMAGIKLDKKTKEQFLSYLTVKDKKGQTEADKRNTWERRIQKEFLNFLDFNVKKVERDVTTSITKNIKKQLSRYNAKGTASRSQPVRVEKPEIENTSFLMPWDLQTDE